MHQGWVDEKLFIRWINLRIKREYILFLAISVHMLLLINNNNLTLEFEQNVNLKAFSCTVWLCLNMGIIVYHNYVQEFQFKA